MTQHTDRRPGADAAWDPSGAWDPCEGRNVRARRRLVSAPSVGLAVLSAAAVLTLGACAGQPDNAPQDPTPGAVGTPVPSRERSSPSEARSPAQPSATPPPTTTSPRTAVPPTRRTASPPADPAAPTTSAPPTPSSRSGGGGPATRTFVTVVRAQVPEVANGRTDAEIGAIAALACSALHQAQPADDVVSLTRSLGTLDAEATDQATARELVKLAIDTACIDEAARVDQF